MSLKKYLKSDIHKKIVVFFHQNPSSVDTAKGVAGWINYEKAKVSKALRELAKENILNMHKASSTTGYSYTTNRKLIKEIEKFIHLA